MLEDIAIGFVNQSEETLQLVDYGLMLLGAVIAGVITRSRSELARAPYFAFSAMIVFFVTAAQIVWLQALPAIGGYLWVLMAISLASSIMGGFYLCRIAMARSRDVYGHGRRAFLAFIPIANLWLLLTPSKNAVSANRVPTIPIMRGGVGVLTGFVLLTAAAGVSAYVNQQARQMEQRAQTEPAQQQVGIEFLIRSNGLAETLRLMAAESQTPITIDDVTTLARIEAVGTRLRRTYVVDVEGMTITEDFRSGSRNGICAWSAFEPILRAGGAIREVYVERGGREIGAVMVTRQECGF